MQELPGLVMLEFKLLSQPFNVSLLHRFPHFLEQRLSSVCIIAVIC
jgi:hypothetical protein